MMLTCFVLLHALDDYWWGSGSNQRIFINEMKRSVATSIMFFDNFYASCSPRSIDKEYIACEPMIFDSHGFIDI